MSWENSLLTTMLSHFVYQDQHGPSVDTFPEFLNAFQREVCAVGTDDGRLIRPHGP